MPSESSHCAFRQNKRKNKGDYTGISSNIHCYLPHLSSREYARTIAVANNLVSCDRDSLFFIRLRLEVLASSKGKRIALVRAKLKNTTDG